MKTFVKDKKLLIILLLSFALPLAAVLGAMLLNGIYPFGEKNMLLWDLKIQYKDYYGYLWDVLHGNASAEYSAAKSLGGQTIGLISYYLTCPLNLLLYFIKKSQISVFVTAVTVLKIAFSGVTSAYYVRKRFAVNSFASIALACCYALMEYNVVYCKNIMWLDAVVMLPLCCWGVYLLINKGRKAPLFFSIAGVILFNWYAGYMACLMTGFYFLYELVLKYDWRNYKSAVKPAIADCFRTAADMILGVLASGVILIPSILSLVGGKAKMNLLIFGTNVGILESLKGLDIYAESNHGNAPIMYCGAIALILAVYIFFDKKIDFKLRLSTGILFVLLIFSFVFKELDKLWTAFVVSHSYAFRWSFVFGFVMIAAAALVVSEIQKHGLNRKALAKSVCIIGVIMLLLDLTGKLHSCFVTYIYFVLIICYAVSMLVIFALRNKKGRQAFCCVMVLLVCLAELGANAAVAFNEYNEREHKFVNYYTDMSNLIDSIKAEDDGFFRLEKEISLLSIRKSDVADSESFIFNYNGIENYTSTYDANVDEFMARMGYSDSTVVPDKESADPVENPTDVYWNSPLILMDSLLSVKYQILRNAPASLEVMDRVKIENIGLDVCRNPYALPLGFNVSKDITDKLEYSENPFENQESLVTVMLGEYRHLYFKPAVSRLSSSVDSEKFELTAKTSGPMYYYIDSSHSHKNDNIDNCELFVNGKMAQKICRRFQYNAVYLGDFNKGDRIELEIKNVSGDMISHEGYYAQLDMNSFERTIEKLSEGYSTNLNIKGNKITGTYETEKDSLIMLTVPYTEGWSLKVDGEKREFTELADTFIGFELGAGIHEIEMTYKTLHKNAGIAATVIGISGFAAWCVIGSLLKKKK